MASHSHSTCVAQLGAQFVQLEVGDLEVGKAALVQGLRVLASARQPVRDSSLSVAEDLFGGGSIQPKGLRRQHHCDVVRGGFQTIQGGVASGSESRVAGLTAKNLDALGMAMLAISEEARG
jgi:hypothetical protein